MKKVLTLAIIAIITLTVGKVSAQSFKFGHINYQEVMQAMPEVDSAQKKLTAYEQDMQEIMKEMQEEIQRKSTEMEEKQSTWSDAIKNAKQRDLADLYRRWQEYAQSSEQQLQQEWQKLFQPIMTKARNAVNKVAKSGGYTYIFDLSNNVVLYWNEAQSTDIAPLVKKELNIK